MSKREEMKKEMLTLKQAMQIITLAVLKDKGIKIARLKGNRNLDQKIVKAKMKSLKATGLLVPAIIVEASLALEEGLEVVDFETGEAVTKENADEYVVLVDANHRFQAHLELEKLDDAYNKDFIFMFPLQDIDVSKMLSEINIATNPWKPADYGKGAAMVLKEELPLLTAINSLTEKGYSVEAACKWLTFACKVTKTVMANAMNGVISEALKKESGIERGFKLIDAAKKSFAEDFLTTRTLPDWIISKADDFDGSKSEFTKKMCKFLSSFNREIATDIEKSKGTRGGDAKETIINRKLNNLWEKFDD